MNAPRSTPGAPPTIADLRKMGVSKANMTCTDASCRHSAYVAFDDMKVGEDLAFPAIMLTRRFTCVACGGRTVNLTPDWRSHRPRGTP